ncbi:MAG: sel1 repeat family protein [Clostridia bacterium]|nr:sel1 repeat family protein [Clostridia bacterium]
MDIEELVALAEQGDAVAQFKLGVCYDKGQGVVQSYKKAVYWYTKSAEQGNANAQNNLGICYINGDGVTESESKAKELWFKAKAQGNQSAIENLRNFFNIT